VGLLPQALTQTFYFSLVSRRHMHNFGCPSRAIFQQLPLSAIASH
jgi:hypothetical protein